MKSSNLLPLVCGTVLLAGCATPKLSADLAPTMTLPGSTSDQLGKRVVQPDKIVLSAPVGYLVAARLAEDTVIDLAGSKYAFVAEEALPAAILSGEAKTDLPEGSFVFCGLPNSTLARDMVALSTLGLSSLLAGTTGEVRVCFIDAQKDGEAEAAVKTGSKKVEDSQAQAVAPVAYSVITMQPMGGESEIVLTYSGKTGLFPGDSISFDLRVVEQGRPLAFDNYRRKVDIGELPAEVSYMGANFTVTAYDPETGAITIDVASNFRQSPYGVQQGYTTRSIPIYVPR